jgi:hypothetical protein
LPDATKTEGIDVREMTRKNDALGSLGPSVGVVYDVYDRAYKWLTPFQDMKDN